MSQLQELTGICQEYVKSAGNESDRNTNIL